MANKKTPGKTKSVSRSVRVQQIIFLTICVIIILAMVLSLATKF